MSSPMTGICCKKGNELITSDLRADLKRLKEGQWSNAKVKRSL